MFKGDKVAKNANSMTRPQKMKTKLAFLVQQGG